MQLPPFQIFGSPDSTDYDLVFFLPELPPTIEARAQRCKDLQALFQNHLASENWPQKPLNANLAQIHNGVIIAVHKGTPDELNNACFTTYAHFTQPHPLQISRTIPRDLPLKTARCLRIVCSMLSRSQFRPQVKPALKGSIADLHAAVSALDLSVPVDNRSKRLPTPDLYKTIAFQLGQTLALYAGIECYTKGEIADFLPDLRPFLLRESELPLQLLDATRTRLVQESQPYIAEIAHLKESDLYARD
ncbi:MAG: hypothetical protein AAF570_08935, partial [Bacteroidota bacterium]